MVNNVLFKVIKRKMKAYLVKQASIKRDKTPLKLAAHPIISFTRKHSSIRGDPTSVKTWSKMSLLTKMNTMSNVSWYIYTTELSFFSFRVSRLAWWSITRLLPTQKIMIVHINTRLRFQPPHYFDIYGVRTNSTMVQFNVSMVLASLLKAIYDNSIHYK